MAPGKNMDASVEKTQPLHIDEPDEMPKFVSVMAPANLPPGFRFMAEVQGYDVNVVVVSPNGFGYSKKCGS
jgi:hypothetical protein